MTTRSSLASTTKQSETASNRLVETGQQPQQHDQAYRRSKQPEKNQSHNSPFVTQEKNASLYSDWPYWLNTGRRVL